MIFFKKFVLYTPKIKVFQSKIFKKQYNYLFAYDLATKKHIIYFDIIISGLIYINK